MTARVRVVLVEPQGGANVGSVCRAIKNMGGGSLAVVRPGFDFEQARRMSVHAADVLADRIETSTVGAALEGCGLVVGTTARTGPWRDRVEDVRDVAVDLARRGGDSGRTHAVVFGREDTGLTNEDVARCHRLITIPSSDQYASLNLAQAVLLVMWEIRRAGLPAAAERPAPASVVGAGSFSASAETLTTAAPIAAATAATVAATTAATTAPAPADAAQVEAMFEQLQDSLIVVGFLSETEPGRVMASVRTMLTRSGMDDRELSILRGIARQVRWFAEGGVEVVRKKRERGELLR